MDLKAALEFVCGQAVKAHGDDVLKPLPRVGSWFHLRQPDGTWKLEQVPMQPFAVVGFTIAGFCAEVDKLCDPALSMVYAGHGRCTAVTHKAELTPNAADRVWMNLPMAHAFAKLAILGGQRTPMGQRAFIDLVRIDLAGCYKPDDLATFRAIKFADSKSGDSTVEQGRASYGVSVKKELTGATAIPEEITLEIPVYEDLAELKLPVVCAVSVDLDHATFALIPLAGELSKAQRDVDEDIAGQLRALLPQHTVVLGSPE